MTAGRPLRIVRVATVPFFLLHHLSRQIGDTVQAGHDVLLVTSPMEGIGTLRQLPGVRVEAVSIPRPIALGGDLRALWQLNRLFRRERPDVVHSTTPKAGLLCAIAAWTARVPVRLHTFTGQAWAGRTVVVRLIGRLADRLIIALDTATYADSASQCAFLEQQGVAPSGRVTVLGAGSLAGVDLQRMDRSRVAAASTLARTRLGLAPSDPVIVFVGRVTRDKGVVELVQAFAQLRDVLPRLNLVLVGPFEPELDPLPDDTRAMIEADPRIHAVGYDPDPAPWLALADLLCLPSYREGFGNVVIEAAALGVPTVGTDIPGLRDAVVDGETGVLVPAKDATALAAALRALLADPARRADMGAAAQRRARERFDARVVNALVLAEYGRLLAGRRRPSR